MPDAFVNQVFTSGDEAAQATSRDDASLPVARIDNGSRFSTRGEYSWFATLCPREFSLAETRHLSNVRQPENLYTISIVVVRRRDRQLTLPSLPGAENAPQGERLFSVTSDADFKGGNGGRISLSASVNVSDTVKIGDWIMLARHHDFPSLGRSVVVRWYRVIGVQSESTLDSSGSFWQRDVTLDGPDWNFATSVPPAPLNPANLTQATLVNGVVTVLERVVRLR